MPDFVRSVLILAFPRAQLLDITGPLQVFASANEFARERGMAAPYAPRIVAAQAGAVQTSSGATLLADSLAGVRRPADTLIVAGGKGVYDASRDARLLSWVRRQAHKTRRVASVCTGAFLLAEAGLLDGRRVVTHWRHCEELASRYPQLHVEADPIFIREDNVWTSAGVTAGIDLALALLEEDLGREVALEVARDLVVFLKRPGGQAQFSAMLSTQNVPERFGELHMWMAEHIAADLSVPVLAHRAAMSERTFMRHYRAATGRTPARAVEQFRVEAAQRMLSETALPIKRIALRCGFGSEETMRRSFARMLSTTPQAYRERFAPH
ncbi:GlxA family transcriptional regulator [Trinickia caryophylli]|uniref:Transcriptional regulator, AraC family with amidase-like domain n=1 Tax=Trinickia caryophylli TaxID=28094 RepID=A0A1X7FUL2_TRICW|nr:GlxA family transcriptional regulator [Trinickia caryophylli]PMS11926.1 GlxA family transcriptional regulator [Trinickia caryophylli]TRX13998.1 GlxA family transcriptional regulator [Trinickia caryophylli]WQE15594.1 GlxA family transcriptional regulator [Trinickia caryophylli]SMF58415.1 transcriptional regulator, AraC family with amidase-like domain [Trinickia caryophylli]GLU33647.1 AraC family transcriptional regulator [Trinickia caryophylli]